MKPLRSLALGCSLGLSFLAGCAKSPWIQDKPQLAPSVRMLDTTLRSSALHRTLHVRIILPEHPIAPMPVLYLLHGAGVDYRDWTNHSPIATLAASNLVLVLPDATGSYYINESGGKHRNYEQYIVQELPQLVRTQVPGAATDRAHTAIAGISRGGFGALALGLRHPEQYGYIGDFSGAIDFPERTFRWRKPFESFTIYRAFGAPGSATRQNYNPFTLAAQLPAQNAPYIFSPAATRTCSGNPMNSSRRS